MVGSLNNLSSDTFEVANERKERAATVEKAKESLVKTMGSKASYFSKPASYKLVC